MEKWKKAIWRTAQAVAVIVIIISAWQLISIRTQYQTAKKEYADIIQKYAGSVSQDKEAETKEQAFSMEIDFESLKEINPDIKGWIYYEGLQISYPVVQGKDNEYYLYHTFEGKKNGSASIFIDMDNKGDFSDYNTFVYGHNMKDGSMFGTLKRLMSEEEIRTEYPFFYIITENKTNQYEIVAAYETQADSSTYRFCKTEEEYTAYLGKIQSQADGEQISADDRMVTLSTCIGPAGGTRRQVVQGILTGQNKKQLADVR